MHSNAHVQALAAAYLASALSQVHVAERGALLASMLTAAAAGLRVIHGPQAAAEAAYLLADNLAAQVPSDPGRPVPHR